MLRRAGGEAGAFSRFSRAIKPPKVVVVSAQAAITTAALGAAALAHSASRIASASLGAMTPGAPQLFAPPGGAGWREVKEAVVYAERPKVERKVFQSAALKTSVSSIRTIDWPWPE